MKKIIAKNTKLANKDYKKKVIKKRLTISYLTHKYSCSSYLDYKKSENWCVLDGLDFRSVFYTFKII